VFFKALIDGGKKTMQGSIVVMINAVIRIMRTVLIGVIVVPWWWTKLLYVLFCFSALASPISYAHGVPQ